MIENGIRRTKKVPPKLKEIIKIVNYLPPFSDLPRIEMLFNEEDKKVLGGWLIDPLEAKLFRLNFQKFLKNYSNEEYVDFWKFIWDDPNPDLSLERSKILENADSVNFIKQTRKAVINYERFFKLNSQFKALIYLLEQSMFEHVEWLNDESENDLGRRMLELYFNEIPTSPKFTFGNTFKVNVSLDEFSQAIDGVDITRIRSCSRVSCKRIFYAGRVGKNYNSKCCSPKCSQLYFSQKSMEKKRLPNMIKRRVEVVKKLREKFNDSMQWTEKAIFIITDEKDKVINSVNLPKDTEIKIHNVDYNVRVNPKTLQCEIPIRFFVELESGQKGYIEIEYGNQFSTNLKRSINLVD